MTAMKLLLLEDDPQECMALKSYIDSREDVNLCGITGNAGEALSMVSEHFPDAVIVDLELHTGGGNGLQFLSSVKGLQLDKTPYLLVTTNNSSHTTHEAARALGADFIMTKYESSYSAEYVVNFLLMMQSVISKHPMDSVNVAPRQQNNTSQNQNMDLTPGKELTQEQEYQQFLNKELNLVGVSPRYVGHQYLMDAIILKVTEPEANILPVLARRYQKSDSSIERAMQYAISCAWRTCDPDDLLTYYTARIHSEKGMPTNMEFVFYYAAKLKIEFDLG